MTTQQLNRLLNKTFNIPVVIRTDTFQNNIPYAAIAGLSNTGFSFTGKELLHAIGSKTASLPSSQKDEAIRCAYLYTNVLDFNGRYLGFNPSISMDSDLQTNRSNEVGIGIGCLIANKAFNVNWDTLESLKGQGKRFDYRATNPGQNHAYEFKGTKYRNKQSTQIQNGIDKKTDMHNRNERYSVELIISSHLNYSSHEPRIVLADPPFQGYGDEFSEQADLFYRLRHYSRIAQFIGDFPLSRTLYKQAIFVQENNESNINIDQFDELGGRTYSREIQSFSKESSSEQITTINVENNQFTGRWISDWIPENKNSTRRTYQIPKITDDDERLEIFQGVTDAFYKTLSTIETGKILGLSKNNRLLISPQNDLEYETFEDGTVMAYRII